MNANYRSYWLATCIGCLLFAAMASAQAFTTIDFPGGFCTQPTAITPSGIIVGRYFDDPICDPNGPMHGFVLAAGRYVPIDIANAIGTQLNWINPSGQIVGDYHASDGRWHGFLLDKGKFTFFDYPGAFSTNAWGISASGDIVGTYSGTGPGRHGYLLTKQGVFSSVDFPGATVTFASMVNEKSIVGFYLDSAQVPRAYLFSGGNYRTVTCSGWDPVILTGLTPQGDMTGGGFSLADNRQHGLVVSAGQCTAIDFPGSVGNDYVNSMNTKGDMVGTYATPDGNSHGYLRTKH